MHRLPPYIYIARYMIFRRSIWSILIHISREGERERERKGKKEKQMKPT